MGGNKSIWTTQRFEKQVWIMHLEKSTDVSELEFSVLIVVRFMNKHEVNIEKNSFPVVLQPGC